MWCATRWCRASSAPTTRASGRKLRRERRKAMIDDPEPGGTLTIDIAEPCALWRERFSDVERLCGEAARAALSGAGCALGPAGLSTRLGGHALVRPLHPQSPRPAHPPHPPPLPPP